MTTLLRHAKANGRWSDVTASQAHWWLAAILVVAAGLRLWAFGGVVGADDVSIAGIALDTLAHGFALPDSHYALRVGLTLPLAGVFAVFGVGEWQLALIPFIASMAGILLAYAIGTELGGRTVGLVSAFVLALFPLDVVYATQFFPDAPLGVLLALSFFLALQVRRAPRPYLWAVAAGLVWGLAYLVKIEAVFMGAVYLAMAAWDRRHWREMGVIIGLFGAVVLAENLVYLTLTGEWLYRIVVIRGERIVMSGEYGGGQLWIFPKAWFVTFYDFGLHYYFLAAAWIWALATRRKALYLLVVWITVYILWLEFGTANPFAPVYSPKSHLGRYLEMINVPMAVLIGALLAALAGRRTRGVFFGAAAVLGLAGLFFVNFDTLSMEREDATKRVLAYAVARDAFPLYLDATSLDIATFLLWNDPRRAQLRPVQQHDFTTGKTRLVDLDRIEGYLLLNRGFMAYKAHRYYMTAFDLKAVKRRFKEVYRVDNPGNALAYAQARLLSRLAALIPIPAVRDKVRATADALLKGEDAVLFRLPPH